MFYTNGKRFLWVHAWDENTDNSVYTYTSDEESYALEEKDEITLFNLLKPELHKTCRVQKADREIVERHIIDVDGIKAPLYFISFNLAMSLGLDVDGDMVGVAEVNKI